MKAGNVHTTRESWLRSATNELRPYFEKLGYTLPEKIRFAIAFTSGGKKGVAGECWHPEASADRHHEIIIKSDKDDPVEILGILVHELVHTLMPTTEKHGNAFKAAALRVGLEGQMRQTKPAPILAEYLQKLAANLGPIPHARLDFSSTSDVPKKQKMRMLKAECGASCGYTIRLSTKWAKAGLPVCPINPDHGKLVCDISEDTEDDVITHVNFSNTHNASAKRRIPER
ncbi:MAG: transcription elongation protein SprT [Alphaproteobacteria bacterium]|nr:transcription elongation protein SprT [Alphaproteobacteria bacterium]